MHHAQRGLIAPWQAVSNIHPTAIVDPRAQIDATASIGPYSVIGAHVVIGGNAYRYIKTMPPMGLDVVGVWQVHVLTVDEA